MTRHITGRAALIAAVVAVVAFVIGLDMAERSFASTTLVAGAVAVALLGALLGYMALYSSQRSIQAVARAAEAIAEGDLRYRAEVSSSATQELEDAFNTMATRVQELVAEAVAEHARLEAVFDAAADALIALAPDTATRYLNPAAAALLRVDHREALGRPFIESARDYELDELARNTVRSRTMQTRVVTFGPDRVLLRAVAVPIEAGGDWAVLLVLNDLTEVQRVDQVRRDFLSNVSHELRTPLASVRAMVETIGHMEQGDGESRAEFVSRSLQQIDRLAALVAELLDLSRIESGAIELHPEEVDLAAAVSEAVDAVRGQVQERSVELELPAESLVIECDRKSLVRIASNLLDNAVKYSPQGAVVSVETRYEGDLVAIAVTDHGPGIAPEDLPRVFERFYKADPSRSNEGVGLGLAIVKHLVRAHRGTVMAESLPGAGTTFTVRLPRKFLGAPAENIGRRPSSLSA